MREGDTYILFVASWMTEVDVVRKLSFIFLLYFHFVLMYYVEWSGEL